MAAKWLPGPLYWAMNAILFPALVTETLPGTACLSETLHCLTWFPMTTPTTKAPLERCPEKAMTPPSASAASQPSWTGTVPTASGVRRVAAPRADSVRV